MDERVKRLYQEIDMTRHYLWLAKIEPQRFLGSAGVCVSRVLRAVSAPEHSWRGFACGTAERD